MYEIYNTFATVKLNWMYLLFKYDVTEQVGKNLLCYWVNFDTTHSHKKAPLKNVIEIMEK